jgi:hypothetical protein
VVEGVEGALGLDGELEAISSARVDDGDRYGVTAWVLEQDDTETVALPAGKLLRLVP